MQQRIVQRLVIHTGISEVTAVKVVKYLVIGMIIVLTVRVMPYMGAQRDCQRVLWGCSRQTSLCHSLRQH
jgi:hypothetical protein